MQPYGDTRVHPQPLYDDADERAARWTVRLLAAGVFVAVIGVAVLVSLYTLGDEEPTRNDPPPEVVTTLPPPPEIGPKPGTEVPGYVAARKAALAQVADERVAVVSLAKYSTQAQAKTLAGTLPIVALLVAPPGTEPAAVTGDLAAWVRTQTEATRTERDEIKKLIPTVTDPAFKTFYTQEVERMDKALKNFAPESAMVFGVVVRGPAAGLKALGGKAEVRLVDVGEPGVNDPKTSYRGLRPEETARANDPPMRPV